MTAASRGTGGEDGFTLAEVLIAGVLGIAIIGAAVTVFTSGVGGQPRIATQASAIDQGRTTMERMIRELRQGSGLVAGSTASPARISFVTYVDSSCGGAPTTTANQCSVTYACGSGACTRQVANPDGSSPGPLVQVVSGLSNTNVFSYSPSTAAPTYVGVTLAYPGTGGSNAITLSDGAAFRNVAGS